MGLRSANTSLLGIDGTVRTAQSSSEDYDAVGYDCKDSSYLRLWMRVHTFLKKCDLKDIFPVRKNASLPCKMYVSMHPQDIRNMKNTKISL